MPCFFDLHLSIVICAHMNTHMHGTDIHTQTVGLSGDLHSSPVASVFAEFLNAKPHDLATCVPHKSLSPKAAGSKESSPTSSNHMRMQCLPSIRGASEQCGHRKEQSEHRALGGVPLARNDKQWLNADLSG